MKIFTLFSVCLFMINTATAQWSNEWLKSTSNKHLLYTNGSIMVGNSSGGNLGLSFVYNSKYSVEVGYSAISSQLSSQIPILKSAIKSNNADITLPSQLMENFNIMAGRHINLNSKETIRFILQGGPGMSVMMEWINPEDNSSNYVQSKLKKSNEFSFMINSKFEFPITDLFGFYAGPTLILNQEKSYLTFTVGFIYGVISKV